MTSVPDLIDTAARLHGETVALCFGGQVVDLLPTQGACSARLPTNLPASSARGRVGVLSANRPGVVVVAHACAEAGPRLSHGWRLTADELEWQITARQRHDARLRRAGVRTSRRYGSTARA